MNELEARRNLLADPRGNAEGPDALVNADERLVAFRDELLVLDEEIHRELTRPLVPDGLADRLILRARYRERSRWGLGIAASVVALALTLQLMPAGESLTLENAMIEHVVESVGELRDDSGVQPALLRASVSELGVRVREGDVRFRHLGRCVVAGREGRHFTIDGPKGPVTFIVLPGRDSGGSDPVMLESQGTHGLFMKRAGSTVGVFAGGNASRAELERWFDAVIA